MIELSEKAKSKAQQRFFGMVRAAHKGELKNPSQEVVDVADNISVKDAKDFAKTKHKGLPEKKTVKEEPERTAEYKAMQASLHPRGSTSDSKQGESATAHRVGGWRKPYLRDRNAKRNRGFRKYAGARVNEGKLDKIMDTVRKYSKKRKAEKKPEKAMDAGARGRRILQRREYADRISGSTENVPDDIRDHYLHI